MSGALKFDSQGQWVWSVGSLGSDHDGQFLSPRGIGIGVDGNLYVCDTYGYRIQVFGVNGELIKSHNDEHFTLPAHIAFSPDGNAIYVGNDGRETELFKESTGNPWSYNFSLFGFSAAEQWVDLAYRDQGTVRIVEFSVADETLTPEDIEHYIDYQEGEYRFVTIDSLVSSFGSNLIHPTHEEEIRQAISQNKLVLTIHIVSSNRNPVSPELAALDDKSIPAYDWLSNELLGNVMVNISIAPRPVRKGDFDDSGHIDLADVILALEIQVCEKTQPASDVYVEAETSGDQKIGIQDLPFVMQEITGNR
ncbi:hypothetical protein [Desulfobacula sp.]|uniref:hypothetical protein n=1 Tax=Desulfobacula sp. TaxID=2593537 RepID=UPI00261EF9EB|nr:hypothetical protein [Desulfobacula sp.]